MKTKKQYIGFQVLIVIFTMILAYFLGTLYSCSPIVASNKKLKNGQIQVTTIHFVKQTYTTDFKQKIFSKTNLR